MHSCGGRSPAHKDSHAMMYRCRFAGSRGAIVGMAYS
jgi:hypothetical protein